MKRKKAPQFQTIDDRVCILLEVIGYFHLPEERAFQERYACLKSKWRKLKKLYPDDWILPPEKGIWWETPPEKAFCFGYEYLREPEQWKEFKL